MNCYGLWDHSHVSPRDVPAHECRLRVGIISDVSRSQTHPSSWSELDAANFRSGSQADIPNPYPKRLLMRVKRLPKVRFLDAPDAGDAPHKTQQGGLPHVGGVMGFNQF